MATAPNDAAAGSVPFLRMAGVVTGGYYLARSAQVAAQQLAAGEGDATFLQDKIAVAQFYAEQILPTAAGWGSAVKGGADLFYAIPAERL